MSTRVLPVMRKPGFGTPRARSRLVFLTGAAVVAGAVGIAVSPLSEAIFSDSSAGVLGGVALVMAAGLPTAMRLRRHSLDAPGLYAVATVVLLGFTSVVWVGNPIRPGPGLSQADIAGALRLVAAGLVAFGIGAWLVGPRGGRHKPDERECQAKKPSNTHEGRGRIFDPSMAPSALALVLPFAASVGAVVLAFALGLYGYVSEPAAVTTARSYVQILLTVAAVGNFVIIATGLTYFATGERRFLILLIGFATVQMAVGFVGGFKGTALLPFMLILGTYVLVRRRWPILPILAAVVFAFVVVLPTNQHYRQVIKADPQAKGDALNAALTTGLDTNPRAVLMTTGDYIGTRFRSIDYIALILDRTPSPFHHAGAENYVLLPAMMVIPRAIWGSKPTLDEGAEFTHTYNQVSTQVRNSTQLTQIGDLYRAFGTMGVLGGMFCAGLLAAAGTRALNRFASPRAQLVYVYAIMTLVIAIEAYLPLLVATASKTLPVAAFTAWLLLPGSRGGPGYLRLLPSSVGAASQRHVGEVAMVSNTPQAS